MTCDEAIRAIDAMLDGEVDEGERFALEAHLGSCEGCRRETKDRFEFSDRLGRALHEAFGSVVPAARRVEKPRKWGTWSRIAAVLLTGVIVGYAGTSLGVFRAAPAEARSVAALMATRDALAQRALDLDVQLDTEVRDLDHTVSRTDEGAARDVAALTVTGLAARNAAPEPVPLPMDPKDRRRVLASKLSAPNWRDRGAAVWAVRELSAQDAALLRDQIVPLDGSNRCFVELVVLAAEGGGNPALDVAIESKGAAVRFVQYPDARIRVQRAGRGGQEVFEAANLSDFQARHPQLVVDLGIEGVDGDVVVAGVRQKGGKVAARPLRYVPTMVWNRNGATPDRIVETLAYESVLADLSRAGVAVEEATRRAEAAMWKVRKMEAAPPTPVRPDPRRTERHLAVVKKLDPGTLALELERIQDDLATLERRCEEVARQISCVRKARATIDAAKR